MPITKYSALSAKTRVMYGNLLTTKDYMELLQQRSISDVAAFLRTESSYGETLNKLNSSVLRRVQLENILRRSLLEDYRKLFCFTAGNVKEFLKIAYLKYEVESFKRLFRVLEMEGDTALLEDSLLFLHRYDTLNIGKLAKARNSQEFISNLKGTKYFDVLRPFLVDTNEHNLFHIEMSLDLYYMNLLLKKCKNLLQGLDATVVNQSLGTEMDVLNLLWIYRGRMIYHLDRNTILSYLNPHHFKLSMDLVYALVDAKEPDAFILLVQKTKYGDLFISDKHGYFELNFSEYMYKMHRLFLRKYGFSITSAISYLHLKEYELSNIISIVEGIRYHLPQETIRRFIIGIQDASE